MEVMLGYFDGLYEFWLLAFALHSLCLVSPV
jgi:hypothetical protein